MFTESECDSEHNCLVSPHVIQHIKSLTGNIDLSDITCRLAHDWILMLGQHVTTLYLQVM